MSLWIEHARIFARGFLIVAFTAGNISMIAREQWVGMFISGFLVSYLWWGNALATRAAIPRAAMTYGLGAAAGTLVGAWLGALLSSR